MDLSPRVIEIETKITKINLKAFVQQTSPSTKNTINKAKRQLTDWVKIFEKNASDKELSFQNIQITHTAQLKKKKIKKWAEDLNRHFSKEGIEITMKRPTSTEKDTQYHY